MKMKPQLIWFILFSCISLKNFSQCLPPPASCTLFSLIVPGDYKARDMIDAKPGTLIQPTGTTNFMHLYTDKTIQLAASYQPSVNYTDNEVNSPVDYNLPVGKIQGQAGVSSTGQATYSIPITLPPGTNGMAPQVGISYNSGMAQGIAGRGWNIMGLSFITRVTKDNYHDTYNYNTDKKINLSGTDSYVLDGMRIIGNLSSGARLENDNLSQITLSAGNYFTVITKEGMIMEYGNTTDSKLNVSLPSGQSVVLSWYLNKVTDKYGNYISYSYYNQNNEVAIKEIKYTGNSLAGILPYNSIKFYYDIRSDATIHYFEDNSLYNILLLREIEINSEGQYVKGYKFNYGLNTQSFLNEIIEYGSDNSKLNSTYFKYGENVTNVGNHVSNTIPKVNGNDIMKDAAYRVGDFNGDGKSDLIAFQISSILGSNGDKIYSGVWKLYINNDDGSTFTEYPLTFLNNFWPYSANDFSPGFYPGPVYSKYDKTNSFFNQIYMPYSSSMGQIGMEVADYDSDGKDDIVIGTKRSGHMVYTVYYSTGSNLDTLAGPYHPFIFNDGINSILADVDGDGIPEGIAYQNFSGTPILTIWSFKTGNSMLITDFRQSNGFPIPFVPYTGLGSVDIDGDGIHELLSVRNGNQYVIKLHINLSCFCPTGSYAQEIYSEALPQFYRENFYGDFNGDGLLDNFVVKPPGSQFPDAELRYGTGSGFTSFSTIGNTFPFEHTRKHIICDINNDGKSDLIRMEATPISSNFYVAYSGQSAGSMTSIGFLTGYNFPQIIDYNYTQLSNPTNYNPYFPGHNTVINNEPEFLTGDFDGDGRQDIFFKTNYNGERAIVFFNKGSTQHLITTISDGFRNKTDFSYATLANSDNNIYVQGNGAVYPVADIRVPFYIVTETSSSNGIGGMNTSTYKYESAKMQMQGKGFLGFDKVSVTNNTSNIRTESESVVSDFFERIPVSNKSYLLPSNISLSEETYYPAPSFETTVLGPNGIANAHFMKVTDITQHDNVTGKTVTRHSDSDGFGNITYNSSEVVLSTGTEKTEITTAYTHAGSWPSVLNAPSTVLTKVTRTGGGIPYERNINYNYIDVLNTGKLDNLVTDKGTTNEVTQAFTYYTAGVCSTKNSTAANCNTCTPKNYACEYDNNFRFVTKEYNPLNQASESQYDPKWGAPIWTKGIDGLTTYFAYDGFGRVMKTTTPDNLVAKVKNEWVQGGTVPADKLGIASNILYSTTATRPGSASIKTFYDLLGRELEQETDGYAGTKIYNEKQYDAKGNTIIATGNYENNPNDYLTTNYFYRDQDFPNELWKVETTDGITNTNTTQYQTTFPGNDGTTKIEITAPDGNVTSKTTDQTGKLIAAHDNGGDIQYAYSSNGKATEIHVNGVTTNSMSYDDFAHQTTLWDKDANTYFYEYDAFGQLTYQGDLKGNTNQLFQYDALGRIESNTVGNGATGESYNYTYNYIPNGTYGVNQLQQTKVSGTNGTITTSYVYDALNRVQSYSENTNGQIFSSAYDYDAYGNVSKITHPNGFSVINEYDNFGYLTKKKEGNTGNTIWQGDAVNALGQYSSYTLGNGVQTNINFNNFGFPQDITAGAMQNLHLVWDMKNGNLQSRSDYFAAHGSGLTETFAPYDNLNRLTRVSGPSALSITYNVNGTIEQKSDAGFYTGYAIDHPDGVSEVLMPPPNTGNISTNNQDILYNAFNKVSTIDEGDYSLAFTYGPDQQRRKTELYYQNGLTETRYFFPEYEKNIKGGNTDEIYYITAPTGLCAMYVVENGVGSMYYVYSDHLGSILKVTNGTNTYEQNFDAWGRNRNPNDWSYTNIPAVPDWLYRGFTGHEHLPHFALINMNGRVYDPVLGMMISPDKNIQSPDFTQNYNRYTYAFNNPLKYTDPSGDDIFDIMFMHGRLISECANWVGNRMNGNSDYQFDWNYISTGELPNSWRNDPSVNLGPNGRPLDLAGELSPFGDHGYDIDEDIRNQSYVWAPIAVAAWYKQIGKDDRSSDEHDDIFDGYQYKWVRVSVGKSNKDFLSKPSHEPYTGFLGKLDYYLNGGISDGQRFNINGKWLGPAPMGSGENSLSWIEGPGGKQKVFGNLIDKFGSGYQTILRKEGKYLPIDLYRNKLSKIAEGSWSKIFESGTLNGEKITIHYYYNAQHGVYYNPFVYSSGW